MDEGRNPDPDGAFLFAYGSNMLSRRLQARVPSAFAVSPGELRGFRLTFDKLGADGSGKARIASSADGADRVFGVLFRVQTAELPLLDRIEGNYERETVEVIARWGHTLRAHTYFARPEAIRAELLPFEWYRDLVAAGAREHRLPPEHVLWLECLPARPDPDSDRRNRERAALRE